MLVKYTHKWASLFPDDELYEEAKRMWALELAGLDLMQIKYALDILVDNHPEWPPTVGEFKGLCKLAKKEKMYEAPQLTNPTKPETVKKSIEEMRKYLS